MKILFASLVALLLTTAFMSPTANAQDNSGYFLSSATHAALDTCTNAGTVTQSKAITGWQDFITVTCQVTKTSGTLGGTLVMYGSTQASSPDIWVQVDSAHTYTVTNTAGSKVYVFEIDASKFQYYKVVWTGTGTMVGTIKTHALWRKDPI